MPEEVYTCPVCKNKFTRTQTTWEVMNGEVKQNTTKRQKICFTGLSGANYCSSYCALKAKDTKPPIHILALGAGVQSSTLALMSVKGIINIDCAIFADTQNEPENVYENVQWLKEQFESADIPLHICTAGDITKDLGRLPLHVTNKNGTAGMLKRACTHRYKIEPISKTIRYVLLKLKKGQTIPDGTLIYQHYGISKDESSRIKSPTEWWKINVYPLCNTVCYPNGKGDTMKFFDRYQSRRDCAEWLQTNYPGRVFPKSACCVCPYRKQISWKRLTKEEFEATVKLDKEVVRTLPNINGTPYLHSKRCDLDKAMESGQPKLYDYEERTDDICDEGICWS